jgi:hypothetical protein
MKLFLQGFLVALLVIQVCNAQKSPIKFGQIPPEDLKMTRYEKDSSAAAVVLTDYGEAAMVFYATEAKLNSERHVRIKILSKEGLKWADASIFLYHSGSGEERIIGFKGSTYNLENGKMVETQVSKDGMFKEKFNKYLNVQKFTFPNVKVGSIIEYSYTISSEYIFNFPDWKFQNTIPTRHSEFWAIIPDFCIYQKYMQGYIPIQYEMKPKNMADFQAKAHHWTGKDVPAFKEEPYMTSEDDYMSKVNFAISHLNFPGRPVMEIMGSWEKLCSNLLEDEDFGKVITGSGFLKKNVEEVTAGITDEKAKLTAIYNYVKNTVEWDGTKDIYADNLKKVIENKKGTAADINLMLGSMLNKAGFNVDMVLISTRDHGFVRKAFPMSKQFNYVICRVQTADAFVFLDATEKYLPIEIIPQRCLNGEGLLVSKRNTGWVNLESKGKSKVVIIADFKLQGDGGLAGKLNYSHHGYAANVSRQEYFKDGQDKFFKNFQSQKAWEVNSSLYENATDMTKPAMENYEIVMASHASVTGNQIYVNPFVSGQLTENPFKSDKREYPVDFGSPIEKVYLGKITIPEGYVTDEIPQNKIFLLPGNAGKFVYSVNVTGNVISVVSNLQINKSLFIQTEYEALREFYNQVVAKQNEQVVLKKVQ